MPRLDGKISLVTGGTCGIGLAAANALAKEGAHVYITGRREPELRTAVQQIGRNETGVRGDVSNADDLDRRFLHRSGRRKADSIFSSRMQGLPDMRPSETSLRNSTIQFSTSTSKECCSQYRRRFP